MNVLLTGGAGYIGSHVALNLLDSGHTVHIIDNLSTGNIKLVPKEAKFTKCNIGNVIKVTKVLRNERFDILMHFAGFIKVEESVKYPDKYFKNNTYRSIIFFNTCKKNGLNKIVFSSTAASYGNIKGNKNIKESYALKPQNAYAESKIKIEKFLKKNSNEFNFIILRYFNVAGSDKKLRSGQVSKKSTHLFKIISEVVVGKRKKLLIFGNDYKTKDGTAIRDYIHVCDLADIHLKAAKYLIKTSKSNIFNCGYGKGYSVLEVLNIAKKLYKNKIDFKIVDRREGDVEKLVADVTKIKRYFNWKPKFNNLDSILKSSINWERKIRGKDL